MKKIIQSLVFLIALANITLNLKAASITLEDCIICTDTKSKRQFTQLPCTHTHCTDCTTRVINDAATVRKAPSCPTCRANIPADFMATLGISKQQINTFKLPPYQMPSNLFERARIGLYCEICPNTRCQRPVEINGRNFVTCECGTSFCWFCNAPRDSENDLMHNTENCAAIAPRRRDLDAEIARRASGQAPLLTEEERQANKSQQNTKIKVYLRKYGKYIAAIAVAGIAVALYKYLNKDTEDKIKEKKKQEKKIA